MQFNLKKNDNMTDLKLIIGNKNYSSWSLRAWFFLKQFKVPFKEIRLPLRSKQFHQEIKKYSPSGKVPALNHGDIKIWDSLAICDYVSEFILSGKGWPSDQANKAIARSICAEMHSGFFGIRNQLPMNCRALKMNYTIDNNTTSEIQHIQHLWKQCLESQPVNSWLFGEFSVADAMFVPIVFRFHTYQIQLEDRVQQYVQFVLENENIKDWLQKSRSEVEVIDDSEIGTDV